MDKNPFSGPVGARIAIAFLGDNSGWRSLGGIARQAGLPPNEVTAFLEAHGDYFVQSTVKPGGLPLYGLREDVRKLAPIARQQRLADRAAGQASTSPTTSTSRFATSTFGEATRTPQVVFGFRVFRSAAAAVRCRRDTDLARRRMRPDPAPSPSTTCATRTGAM